MCKKKSAGCAGRGDIACPTCSAEQEPGIYKQNQMSQCPACYARGLIAHRDGSDTMWAVSSLFNSIGWGFLNCRLNSFLNSDFLIGFLTSFLLVLYGDSLSL